MFGGRFLHARYVNLSWRLINLSANSEGNDILSFGSYFQPKGVTFLRHPVEASFLQVWIACLVTLTTFSTIPLYYASFAARPIRGFYGMSVIGISVPLFSGDAKMSLYQTCINLLQEASTLQFWIVCFVTLTTFSTIPPILCSICS